MAVRRLRSAGDETATFDGELDDVVGTCRRLGWIDRPELAFPCPPPPTSYDSSPARSAQFRYQRITFDSGYAPPPDFPVAARWLEVANNRTIHAWVMRHPGPQRPWMVCLHGTAMGYPFADLGLFRANWLYNTMGVNVACPVLPLHGPRRPAGTSTISYPSDNGAYNLHGTLQAVWDVRRVIAYLRSQGNEQIGLIGVSLGGMVAALVGDLDADLSCVVLGAPVAEIGALVERHKGGTRDAHGAELTRQLDAIISPLSISPKTPRDRRFIYAGVVDKMVHPRFHGGRIWEHWDRPEALWYGGGHASLGFSREVGRFIEQAMRASDVVGPSAA